MIRWYRLIKWVNQQRKNGFYLFSVVTSGNEFVIFNTENDEQLRIKY